MVNSTLVVKHDARKQTGYKVKEVTLLKLTLLEQPMQLVDYHHLVFNKKQKDGN